LKGIPLLFYYFCYHSFVVSLFPLCIFEKVVYLFDETLSNFVFKKHSHKKEKNEQFKKRSMSNQKTTLKNANTLMRPIMKSYGKLLNGGKQTTSHLSHEVYFLKNG